LSGSHKPKVPKEEPVARERREGNSLYDDFGRKKSRFQTAVTKKRQRKPLASPGGFDILSHP
jgi:hypothetical protein